MAYNYLEESDIEDALHDSEGYMQPKLEHLAEIERVTHGRPGKVPAGKPRVTDGTLAGMRRKLPKAIIQQLPAGTVTIQDHPDMNDTSTGIFTDVFLENANSGGEPFMKSKLAIKSVFDTGAAWAYCFFNRTGLITHADYRLKGVREVLFEKGKISEFDTNYLLMVDWMTKGDVKAAIYYANHLSDQAKASKDKDFKEIWDAEALQKLLDESSPQPKDDPYKTETEKKNNADDGYYKVVYALPKGVKAQFFVWSPAIKQTLGRWTSKDPRGIIPLHGFIPEPDGDNPHGEPLAAISVPKQNLQDFNMQMYQYQMAIGNSPPVKKWGKTPNANIKLAPDNIIQMRGTPATDDFQVVNINNAAIANFSNNYGLIKSQIMNEMDDSSDNSVSAASGNPGFSKTQAGVKAQTSQLSLSYNDIRMGHESWLKRVWETCMNLQFAHSQGSKTIDLQDTTMKRLNIQSKPTVDYSKDYGLIKLKIDPGTSQSADQDKENEKMSNLFEIKQKFMQNADDKAMLMYNQLVKNSGVKDPVKLQYTEQEIAIAKKISDIQMQKALQALTAPPPPAMPAPGPMPAAGPQPDMQPAAPPAPAANPVAQDREAARQQIISRGVSPHDAELLLQRLDQQGPANA